MNNNTAPHEFREREPVMNTQKQTFCIRMNADYGVLEHHGILGMHWGVRRFQNADGSLTDEGRKRYGVGDERESGQNEKSDNAGRTKDGNAEETGDAQKGSDHLSYFTKNRLKREYRDLQEDPYRKQIWKEKASGKKISSHRQKLTELYVSKGMEREDAEVAALKRSKLETYLKVAGGVALTAGAVYGAYKGHQWLVKNMDRSIAEGSDIFRLSKEENEELGRAAYVVDNREDAERYTGIFGKQITQQRQAQNLFKKMIGQQEESTNGTGLYQIRGKANKAIKVAGDRQANKVYRELLQNDKIFAEANEKVLKRWHGDFYNNSFDTYADFNTRLVDHTDDNAKIVQEKFYNALKAKGYGGVMDVNDRDNSGYNTKHPIILFNLQEHINSVTRTPLKSTDIDTAYENAIYRITRENDRKSLNDAISDRALTISLYTGIGAASTAALGKYNQKIENQAAITRNKKYQTVIREYKKDHPNTKLTDREILENELGKNKP